MATSDYVGVDVSKDRLDVAVLGEERGWQVDNTQAGITELVQQMKELQPELIVVEEIRVHVRVGLDRTLLAEVPVLHQHCATSINAIARGRTDRRGIDGTTSDRLMVFVRCRLGLVRRRLALGTSGATPRRRRPQRG